MKKKAINQNNGLGRKDVKSHAGFTLIELSLVLLITGIMVIPLIRLYSEYLYEQKIIITKTNLDKTAHALALASVIRYPCPSNRALPKSDANYGVDVCSIAGFTLAGIPNCNTTGLEQGICKTPGARDTTDDADLIAGTNNEFVLIGGAPLKVGVKAIGGATGSTILDGWNDQFTYAVSYTSARPNRAEGFTRFKDGVIKVVDEWGNDTAGTKSDAHFILISHGQDGLGSYNNNSVRRPCVIANVDGENCDGDSTFVLGISHYGGTMKYDDYSYVQSDSSANLWQIVTDPANSNAPTAHISTIPNGKIGINMTTPGLTPPSGVDVRLDVNGNIRADTIRAMEICKKDGTRCLSVDSTNEFFGSQKGAGNTVQNDCADGEVISSIGNSKVTCSKADVQFKGVQVRCPLGKWLEQIFTDGTIKCTGGIICPGGAGCT